ncbi:MAG TPA: nucleoside diphosphate kinase regulator [Candidatus Omnitrophota bacterium]|nr:nucleoside diphosphate kinase regulator [Candidatus Omnitrophota bacterium]HPB68438.1 nucleoside diphosphate kinase regulator [Candidatus Omnitrophota bacterium]HQO58578.1 nucleoside diphosphate kinase regulator [Candidatus Omnitrophota bacterium]HQP11353.1 nucleoside diphosphate kinase regulator [Candidatus Omnitrophota bacterium]
MTQGKIFVTPFDKERLQDILLKTMHFNTEDHVFLKRLEEELSRADVVDSKEIPPDIITMNSMVCVEDMDTGDEETYSLVFPGHANYQEHKISVLAPIGTALLGYKEGDVIEWPVPAGLRKLRIKRILYQPEANGEYHL